MTSDQKELEELIEGFGHKPELRLFVSVDVVGSTALKAGTQLGKDNDLQWQNFFSSFYKEFINQLAKQVEEKSLSPLMLWKILGDELLFSTVLKSLSDISAYLEALFATIAGYKQLSSFQRLAGNGLNLKSTAWLAGFPVGNLEVTNIVPEFPPDYIGPSVDIGFRLAALATPDRTPISIDLVYLLHMAQPNSFILDYNGKVGLKGVLNNKPYPVFYIDHRDQESLDLENAVTGKTKIMREHAGRYAKNFLEQNCEKLFLPFILGKNSFGDVPSGYAKQFSDVLSSILGLEKAGEPGEASPETDPNIETEDFPDQSQIKPTDS